MAEERRLTKAERREKARRERRQEQKETQKRDRRRRILTIVGTVAGVAGVVALITLTGGGGGETGITIAPAAAEEAATDAGCAPVDMGPIQSTDHVDQAAAPPAEALYPQRPTYGGPHFPNPHPSGVYDDPIDERATTHSMEHGGVILWYVPDALDSQTVGAITDWARARNSAGFAANPQFGAGIIVAPFPDGTSTGKPIALRAWNVALDCEQFDETAADAFLIANFASHGQSPEGRSIEYPENVLAFEEGAGEGTEAPTDGGTDAATPAAEDSPADASSPAETPAG